MGQLRLMSPPKILVTGASGFIGSRLCRRLLEEPAEVHAVGRRHLDRIPAGAEAHALDLGDAAAVGDLVAAVRPEVVFHLASHVAGARDADLLLPTFRANLASTVHLLGALAGPDGCRLFVQAGSLEEPAEADATPSSPYAAAKWAAAGYLRMARALYGLPFVRARMFMVYGPGQWDLRKLVPYTVLSLLEGGEPAFSSGERPVDWVFVDDVVEGLARIGARRDLDGATVDLGSGGLATVREVVETLFAILAPDRRPRFGARDDRPAEQVRRAAIQQTERLLGWRPATGLRAGLEATIDWYRRELESGRLQR